VRIAATIAWKSLTVPLRHAAVVQHDLEDVLLQHVLLVDLHRRNTDAFLEDRLRVGGQLPGTLPPMSVMWPNMAA
jgi:hypothetical protein